jgi:hypothetical protein
VGIIGGDGVDESGHDGGGVDGRAHADNAIARRKRSSGYPASYPSA